MGQGPACGSADALGMSNKEKKLLQNVFVGQQMLRCDYLVGSCLPSGLASRSPGRTMDKKTFLDYVEFYGGWRDQLPGITMHEMSRCSFSAALGKNKLIDLEEFMTGIARFLNGSMSEKIQLLFKMFDLRADGQVSLEELRTMLYSMLKHKELYTVI
eukprot:1378943-Amorphochlora_amoeboformis.AAC.3